MNWTVRRGFYSPMNAFDDKPLHEGVIHAETIRNQAGQVVEERKYFEDGSLDEVHRYQLDQQGRVVEEILTYALSEGADIHRYTYDDATRTTTYTIWYDDEPGETTITRYNEAGQVVYLEEQDADQETISITTYQYDAAGQEVSQQAEEDGEVVKTIRSFYEDGLLVRQELVSMEPDEINQVVLIRYEGLRSISEAYDEVKSLLYTRIHDKDEKGRITRIAHQDAGDGRVQIEQIGYNEQGLITEHEWIDGGGNLLRKQLFTYTEAGDMLTETFFEPNPYEAKNTHYIIRYEYA